MHDEPELFSTSFLEEFPYNFDAMAVNFVQCSQSWPPIV